MPPRARPSPRRFRSVSADITPLDALIPALVGAAVAELGDKSPWLAALIAARTGKPGQVAAGAVVAAAVASTISAIAGGYIQPLLTPNARLLFLALALLFAGGGALLPLKAPEALERWRIGAFATSALGLFILQFGEGTQFLVAGIAANAKLPALAAVGATIGIAAITVPLTFAGPALRDRMPLRAIRWGSAAVFLISGVIAALSAVRLV